MDKIALNNSFCAWIDLLGYGSPFYASNWDLHDSKAIKNLYRLKNPEEVFELGIEDAFYDGVSLIEWPEKMGKIAPEKKLLKIKIECDNNIRTFTFSSENPQWIERLNLWNVQI